MSKTKQAFRPKHCIVVKQGKELCRLGYVTSGDSVQEETSLNTGETPRCSQLVER